MRELAGLRYQRISTWVFSALTAPSQVLDLINGFVQRLLHVIRLPSANLFHAAGIIGPARHGNEDEGFGSLSSKASDRIANLSRSGIRNVAKADKRDVFRIEAEDARHRKRVGTLRAHAYPLSFDELGQNECHRL